MAGIEDYVRVRMGWAANPTQSLAGVTWTDETARVREVSISRGRSSWPGAWPPGTATILFSNEDGDLSIDDATYGARLKPGRAVIVEGKDSGGTWRPLFTGHVRARGGYVPNDRPPDSTLTVHAVDLMGTLGNVGVASVTPTAGNAGGYVAGLLTAIGYSSVDDAIDTGVSELDTAVQAWTSDAAAFLRQVAASEGGEVYCLKDGTLNFDDRGAPGSVSRMSSVQSTISDDGGAGTIAAHRPSGIVRTWGDRVATTASATDYEGTEHTATDTGAVGYETGSYNVGRTFATAAHAEAVATFWTMQMSVVDAFPYSCTIKVASAQAVTDTDHQNFACNRELRDRITFELTEPGRSQTSHDVAIESIRHRVTTSEWSMALTFVSGDFINGSGVIDPGWFILDSSALDGSDVLAP